jgi:uncharacterized protein (TIGR02118 family)
VYKIAWLVKLAGTEDREARSRRWSEEHSELMRAVPDLERHTVNRGLSIAEGPGAGREAPTVDGVACAWFSDRASCEAGLGSPEWQTVLDHGRIIFDQAWEHAGQAVEIEERVMRSGPGTNWSGAGVPPGMCKHIGVLRFRHDLTREAGRAWWTEVHGPIALAIPEIRYYVQNHATRAFRLDGTDRDGVFAFDGFSEAWFTDRPTFERAHESPAWHALREDAPNLFDMQALDSGVNMVVDERVIKG